MCVASYDFTHHQPCTIIFYLIIFKLGQAIQVKRAAGSRAKKISFDY